MSRRLYGSALNALARLAHGDVHVSLMRDSYRFDVRHATFSDIADFSNGVSGSLSGKVIDDDVFDADDTVVVSDAMHACHGLALFVSSGGESPLMGYLDGDAFGRLIFPYAGQAVVIKFDDGPGKILTLIEKAG